MWGSTVIAIVHGTLISTLCVGIVINFTAEIHALCSTGARTVGYNKRTWCTNTYNMLNWDIAFMWHAL